MLKVQEGRVSFPKMEEEMVQWWKENNIYEKSLARRENAPAFVFFEGPPTANGMPHPGHCLTRAMKDIFPRYRTMRGYRCERKAGWDTHGLPVELEVCKELGLKKSREEIENYGIEPFIQLCQKSVWRYMQEWEHLTERIGFWIHLDKAYVTYHQSFVESVWWALSEFFKKDLLYQGHKIVWWWAQGGTALSSGEVGEGYREVADPAVYVRYPVLAEEKTPEVLKNADLVIWTTTPWTLSSNQFVAVKTDMEYCVVKFEGDARAVVIAEPLLASVAQKYGGKKPKEYELLGKFTGEELVGVRYLPPFDTFYRTLGNVQGTLKTGEKEYLAWRVVPADFVTVDTGTGLVHQAPAFGEDDFGVLQAQKARFVDGEGPDMICAVASNGTFTEVFPEFQGRWVKEADRDIIKVLKEKELLLIHEQYLHEYPFYTRSDDPLIQYPRKSWFIKTSQFRDSMLKNNAQIKWLPEHIRDGRFGNFLSGNVDWALSRERFWGTPLPIWVCEKTGKMEAIANYDELMAKPGVSGMEVWMKAKAANPDLPEDLKVHKPYIDEITYDSPFGELNEDGSVPRMRRVPEVIDCWFDSGAMPFAQWGYPHKPGSEEEFKTHFPADFISEAIDQTRGWFYSQLAISTLLFGDHALQNETADRVREYPHPFKTCVVLGLMLAEWWENKGYKDPKDRQIFLEEDEAKKVLGAKNYEHKIGKMSKSLRNYRSPNEIFDKYGADALRWYFYSNQAPWNAIIYSERAIAESMPAFTVKLWDTLKFLVGYANSDGFEPEKWLEGDAGQMTPDVLKNAKNYRPVSERAELDRWIMSKLNSLNAFVIEKLDAYDNHPAAAALLEFVDALSNWYIRRSKESIWSSDKSDANCAKWDTYWTLYECLVTLSKLIAPFVPFMAEQIWNTLVREPFGARAMESVHLCDYPTPSTDVIDETLAVRMDLMREICSQGHSARQNASLKVKQPLSGVDIVLTEASRPHRGWLTEHDELIREELNVKEVRFTDRADDYVSYTILPDLKKLGKKLGKLLPILKNWLTTADGAALLAQMEQDGQVEVELDGQKVAFTAEELIIRLQAKEGFAASQGKNSVVVLTTELTPELIAEGNAREIVRAIQSRRKDLNCAYADHIRVCFETEDAVMLDAAKAFAQYICGETLADELIFAPTDAYSAAETVKVKLAGAAVQLTVLR
ncbi:MAG: isoleucine--tRNA ligase [Planctomycetaceae bacterium]|nr:isoleucine--tRNA ligase [Planctomycetaceae bacterium]